MICGIYDIEPICGIDKIIEKFKESFSFKKTKCIVCTYTYNPLVIDRLFEICDVLRIFIGKGAYGRIRGANVTLSHTHFKCIYMWDNEKTCVYIGSENLGESVGFANYGLFITNNTVHDSFDTRININNYADWNDPLYVIMCDVITRVTGSRCEQCNRVTDNLFLDNNANFVCENCL